MAAARTDVRDLYLDINKQVQGLRSGVGGADIQVQKLSSSIGDIEERINKLLSSGNISKAQKLMMHLSKARELQEVAEEIQKINEQLKVASETTRTGLNQELMVAVQKFKDLKEDVMDVGGEFGKLASKIEAIVGPGALGAGFWDMTQNTLKLEAATIGYGEALDELERPGTKWLGKLIDVNFEIDKFKAQLKGAKDYGVPVQAITAAIGEMVPNARQLNMSLSEITELAPKLGAGGRMLRQDMGSSLEYLNTRMLKMNKTQGEVLDEMGAMRSVVDQVNEKYGQGTLKVEDMSNTIFELAKRTKGYGMDTEYLSLVLGRHAGRLKTTGMSYQAIKESMEDFGTFLTEVPEHWKFDLGKQIFGGITTEEELSAFMDKQGWDKAIKSKLLEASKALGGPTAGLFQQVAFETVSQTEQGMSAIVDRLSRTEVGELAGKMGGGARGMTKALDLISTAKEIKAGTKDISEFKDKMLKDLPNKQLDTFEEGAARLEKHVGSGVVNEIKAVYSVIQGDFAKILGGAAVTAHTIAMNGHTIALIAQNKTLLGGTMSKLGAAGGVAGKGGMLAAAGMGGYAIGTGINALVENYAPGVNRWFEEKIASTNKTYRDNVAKTEELNRKTAELQERIRAKQATSIPMVDISGSRTSGSTSGSGAMNSSSMKVINSLSKGSVAGAGTPSSKYSGTAVYSGNDEITIKARMVGGMGEIVAAGNYDNRNL